MKYGRIFHSRSVDVGAGNELIKYENHMKIIMN